MKLLPQSEAMRRNMIDSQLRTSGVNVPWILAAMQATPRELFVTGDGGLAYMDRAAGLGGGRKLNPPVAAGQMLQVAEPAPADRVLLVAAGAGYLAALLAPRVATLVAVEESAELAALFRSNLPAITLIEAANAAGAAADGHYDLIIIDGAIEQLPDALTEQLAEGGRLVTGLIDGPVTTLAHGVKLGGQISLRPVGEMEIAPLPGFAPAKEFVF